MIFFIFNFSFDQIIDGLLVRVMCFSFSAIQQAADGRIRRTYNSGKFILFTSVPGRIT